MKYGELNLGQVEAIVNKLGGMKGAQKFLHGEITVTKSESAWCEHDGVIYFSVTSDGTTGLEWIKRLESKGFRVSDYAKSVLRSSDFKPTDGMTTEVIVLKGILFSDKLPTMKRVRAEADKRKLTKPNAEVACLIREKFRNEELEVMGLWWIITMHEPIKESDGDPFLLSVNRDSAGVWLDAYDDYPNGILGSEGGFAFVRKYSA